MEIKGPDPKNLVGPSSYALPQEGDSNRSKALASVNSELNKCWGFLKGGPEHLGTEQEGTYSKGVLLMSCPLYTLGI